eukprot:scaffold66_cov233-Pinguiococcus_pyrenoidosus.AAC.11
MFAGYMLAVPRIVRLPVLCLDAKHLGAGKERLGRLDRKGQDLTRTIFPSRDAQVCAQPCLPAARCAGRTKRNRRRRSTDGTYRTLSEHSPDHNLRTAARRLASAAPTSGLLCSELTVEQVDHQVDVDRDRLEGYCYDAVGLVLQQLVEVHGPRVTQDAAHVGLDIEATGHVLAALDLEGRMTMQALRQLRVHDDPPVQQLLVGHLDLRLGALAATAGLAASRLRHHAQHQLGLLALLLGGRVHRRRGQRVGRLVLLGVDGRRQVVAKVDVERRHLRAVGRRRRRRVPHAQVRPRLHLASVVVLGVVEGQHLQLEVVDDVVLAFDRRRWVAQLVQEPL